MKLLSNPKKIMAAWPLLMEESFHDTNPKCFESDLPIFFSRENDQSHKLQRKIEKSCDGMDWKETQLPRKCISGGFSTSKVGYSEMKMFQV